MRIVVSTIGLNEPPEFVERWVASARDADEVVLVDTGSTNGMVECARDLGVTVHRIRVSPWRFDTARNAALALLPECDAVVTLDVDEVLWPGWRSAMEKVGPAQRYAYRYLWSPEVEFLGDRAHSRHGWVWRHPCHETLYRADGGAVAPTFVPGMVLQHLPDDSKPRAQYLPLLERAVAEEPDNDRMAHYYARELYFHGDWVAARREFVRHLSLPSAQWPAERAQSYRFLAKMDDDPERWLLHAVAEDPWRREAWVDLARLANARGLYQQAAGYVDRALMVTDRTGDYLTEAVAWDDDELLALSGPVWDHADMHLTSGKA